MLKYLFNRIKKEGLIKDTLIYGLTNAVYSGLPLLLMPFLIIVLAPEEYGVVDFYRTFSLVLTPILGLSTVQSISRFYFDLNSEKFKYYVSSIVIFHIFMTIVGISILLVFHKLLDHQFYLISFFSIVYFLFNQITEALLAIYRVEKKSQKYLVLRLAVVGLDLLILAGLYYFLNDFDWTYRVYPNVIAIVIIGIISFILLCKRNGFVFKKKLLGLAIVYSSPLIVHMLSGYILNLGDRFFILHFLNKEELGRYAVAYQIGMSVNFFYTSFNLAWMPTFYEWMEMGKYSQIRKVEKIVYLAISLLGIIIFLIFIAIDKYTFLLKNYSISYLLVGTILLSYIIFSFYKMKSNYFFYNKRTKLLSSITFLSAIITIGLNYYLIPKIGIYGSAIATLISILFLYLAVSFKLYDKKSIISS